jgi:hypothetical protein
MGTIKFWRMQKTRTGLDEATTERKKANETKKQKPARGDTFARTHGCRAVILRGSSYVAIPSPGRAW